MVFDASRVNGWRPERKHIRYLADRRKGVGCDQVLAVARSSKLGVDLTLDIWNSDGGRAEQCGNGLRCVAMFAYRCGIVTKPQMRIQVVDQQVLVDGADQPAPVVDMGQPILTPERIPFVAPGYAALYEREVGGKTLMLGAVSMGNPHAVVTVADLERAPVAELGPAVQSAGFFPQGVNVGFMQILERDRIRLRVYERGAGETRACGSGACAAVVSGVLQGRLSAGSVVQVLFPDGVLEVQWAGSAAAVLMKGAAVLVFHGQIEL